MSEQRVVVGVDGSVASFQALDTAAAEATRRAGFLDVVMCGGEFDEPGPFLRAAAARIAERHPELTVFTSPAVGDPADILLAKGRDAVLVVVGSRGLGAGLLLRSVSQRMAARTTVPLLVVRTTRVRRAASRSPAGGVLLGLESDNDADAALFAFEEAQSRRTRLDVLHAWTYRQALPPAHGCCPAEPLQDTVARQATAAAILPRELVSPLLAAFPNLEVETRSVRSTPCRALIEATADAQLLVIAAHRRTTRLGIQLGPVIAALLHHAHCPVAVVPAPET